MEKEDSCDTALSLGLALAPKQKVTVKEGRLSSPHSSTISSFSTSRVKKEKKDDFCGEETTEVERGSSSRAREEDEDASAAARKKLRLTKEQSALLENRFKEHTTLNPKQKQTLAKQLNLRARQIEVWFQNRRARTKLKQTEVDCEFLRRCCETLTEENRRLQKELQELKSVKFSASSSEPLDLFMKLPAATLMVCPSCERIAGAPIKATDAKDIISPRTFINPPQHFFNPFPHSATC